MPLMTLELLTGGLLLYQHSGSDHFAKLVYSINLFLIISVWLLTAFDGFCKYTNSRPIRF